MTAMTTGRASWRKPLALTSAMLAVIGLAACSPAAPARDASAQSGAPLASDTALDGAWQQRTYKSIYEQKIDWHPCTAEDGLDDQVSPVLEEAKVDVSAYECGTVKAPMDWANPSDTRTIDLAVVRIPSTGDPDKAIPLFMNPGGPGASGVQQAMSMPATPAFTKVMETHEAWGFDPRGVGRSTPVSCPSDSEIGAVQLAECAKTNPIAHYMGTSYVARDMELLRVLSGAPRLDYLGYSYGTMLGATYATLFPSTAGRMILDSAENAKWGSIEHNYDQQVAVAKAAGALADSCTKMTTLEGAPVTCPFTSEREMLDYKKSLDETPLKASDGTEITGSELRDFLTSALYNFPEAQASSLDLLGKAKSGDQQAIDELSAQIASGGAEIDTAGQLTVCPSTPKTPDLAGLIEHIKKVGVPEFIGGPELTDEVISEYTKFECASLAETGTDFTDTFDASKVKNPLLVIGITGDHATPFQHGKELAEQLGKASFLTLEGTGHGASFSERSSCVDAAAVDYLNTGALPEEGTVCQAE